MTTEIKNEIEEIEAEHEPEVLKYPLPREADDTFPLYDVFPEWLAQYVDRLSLITQTRRGSNALLALSAIATSLCKGLTVQGVGKKVVKPNLFILLGAGVGYGKSEACDEFLTPLTRMFRTKTEEQQGRKKAELLVEKKQLTRDQEKYESGWDKDAAGKKIKLDEDVCHEKLVDIEERLGKITEELKTKVWAGRDVTSETLKEIMGVNGGLFFSASPDAKKTIQVTEGLYKQGQSDEAAWLSAYSWEDDDSLRADGKYKFIYQPCANLCWSATNDGIASLVKSGTLAKSGFISRCIIQIEPRSLSLLEEHEDIPHSWRTNWMQLLNNNVNKFIEAEEPLKIQYHPKAKERLRTWGNEVKKEIFYELQHIEDQAARWAEHAWRISLSLHCLANPNLEPGEKDSITNPISMDTVEKAIKIADWIIVRQKVLWEFKGDNESSDILKVVKESLKKWSKNTKDNPGKFFAATLREIKRGENAAFDKLNIPHTEALEGALMPALNKKELLCLSVGKTKYYILNTPSEVERFMQFHKLSPSKDVDLGQTIKGGDMPEVKIVIKPPAEPISPPYDSEEEDTQMALDMFGDPSKPNNGWAFSKKTGMIYVPPEPISAYTGDEEF